MAPIACSAARSWVAGLLAWGQTGAHGDGHRREHGVQAHGEAPGSDTGKLAVHPRLRVVEPSAGRDGKPLSETANKASSGNRIPLWRNPFPSSTDVSRAGHQNVGWSRRPPAADPESRRRSIRSRVGTRLDSISVSPRTPPDSARMAAATTAGRSAPDSAASRSRTRSINDPLIIRRPRSAPRRAPCGPLRRAGTVGASANRRSPTAGRVRARAASRRAVAVRPPAQLLLPAVRPAAGPRTTSPMLACTVPGTPARAAVAAMPRMSQLVMTATRSADSRAGPDA